MTILAEHHGQLQLRKNANDATITSRWKPTVSLDKADGYTTPKFTERAKQCGIDPETITKGFKTKLDAFRR